MLGIAALAAAWPVATAAWLPFVDYPQHAAAVAAFRFADDPRYAPYYAADLAGAKYVLFHLAGAALVPLVGAEAAPRLVVAAFLGLLPLAVAAFLAAHRRPPLLGALAGLVALHLYVFWGFVGHVVGFPLAILGLAAHEHALRRPGVARFAGFGAVALLSVLAHPLTFAWMGLGLLLQALRHRPRAPALLRTALAALPALALFAFFAGSFSAGGGDVRTSAPALGRMLSVSALPDPLGAVRAAPRRAFGYYDDGAGSIVGVLFALALGAFLATRLVGRERPASGVPEILLGVTLALYFVVPSKFLSVHLVGVRFLPMALALAAALGPPRLDRPLARLALGVILVASSATAATIHVAHFRLAGEELAGLERVLAAAEPGRRLLGMVLDPRSDVVATPAHVHAAQYYTVLRGGFAAVAFTSYPTSAVRTRPGVEPAIYPPHFEWMPDRGYDDATLGRWFDYFLVRERRGGGSALEIFAGSADPPLPVARAGRWVLLERAGADTGTPPGG